MSKPLQKRDKWHFLRLDARWDRTVVPIYETAARGKCVPLLKTLLTSHCQNECTYCSFRAGRKCVREMWEPDKLAEVTLHLWKERKIMGLFLSSSVFKDPDYITEKQLLVLRTLRKSGYTGYVHLRIMPGVSRFYLHEAIELSDRVGVNLEAPDKGIYDEICPDKGGFEEAVLKRLEWIVDEAKKARSEEYKPKFGYGRAGVDTQMIVGAVDDDDWQYLQMTERLYKKLNLKRVYYSGFEPLPQTPLEGHAACSPSREYRLYQSSFLLRDYGFSVDNFSSILDDQGFLSNLDPKLAFAKTNPDIFPINLNTATYHEIVKIPHIGPITAKKIIKARENVKIRSLGDMERVMGANFTRRVSPYVELKDKRLTEFLKVNKAHR